MSDGWDVKIVGGVHCKCCHESKQELARLRAERALWPLAETRVAELVTDAVLLRERAEAAEQRAVERERFLDVTVRGWLCEIDRCCYDHLCPHVQALDAKYDALDAALTRAAPARSA